MSEAFKYELIPEVYIIESAKITDYIGGLQEGKALQESLNIMRIPNYYFPIFTKAGFQYIVEQIRSPHYFSEDPDQKTVAVTVPVIHISAHGAEGFFRLTDDTDIPWTELKNILSPINKKCFDSLVLCMSVCHGFMAFKSAETLNAGLPFNLIIGPKESVLWQDSLLAFLILYRRFGLLMSGEIRALKSVMNNAISKDLFEIVEGAVVQKAYYNNVRKIAQDILRQRLSKREH